MTDKKSSVVGQSKPDATKRTARERIEREMRENPQCTEAPKMGKGFIIGGGSEAVAAHRNSVPPAHGARHHDCDSRRIKLRSIRP
jgi:hypothetical protein